MGWLLLVALGLVAQTAGILIFVLGDLNIEKLTEDQAEKLGAVLWTVGILAILSGVWGLS